MSIDTEFYRLQNRWTGIYEAPIGDHHRDRAGLVASHMSGRGGVSLELGAGGGQISAAVAGLGCGDSDAGRRTGS